MFMCGRSCPQRITRLSNVLRIAPLAHDRAAQGTADIQMLYYYSMDPAKKQVISQYFHFFGILCRFVLRLHITLHIIG